MSVGTLHASLKGGLNSTPVNFSGFKERKMTYEMIMSDAEVAVTAGNFDEAIGLINQAKDLAEGDEQKKQCTSLLRKVRTASKNASKGAKEASPKVEKPKADVKKRYLPTADDVKKIMALNRMIFYIKVPAARNNDQESRREAKTLYDTFSKIGIKWDSNPDKVSQMLKMIFEKLMETPRGQRITGETLKEMKISGQIPENQEKFYGFLVSKLKSAMDRQKYAAVQRKETERADRQLDALLERKVPGAFLSAEEIDLLLELRDAPSVEKVHELLAKLPEYGTADYTRLVESLAKGCSTLSSYLAPYQNLTVEKVYMVHEYGNEKLDADTMEKYEIVLADVTDDTLLEMLEKSRVTGAKALLRYRRRMKKTVKSEEKSTEDSKES